PGNYGFSVVQIELAPGATLRETTDVAEQVRKRLMQFPDVVRCYTTVGAGGSNGFQASAGAVRKATLTLQLLPHKQQKRSQAEFEADASKALRDFPGVRLSFGTGGFGEKLQISLAGDDPALLAEVSQRVEKDVRESGLANVTSSASLVQPEIVIQPVPERAAELGVPTEALSAATRIATSGDVPKKVEKMPTLAHLPEGVERRESGDVERMRELFGGFLAAMGVGLLCIYAVLVLLFHDFIQPLTILGALPQSVGGALAGLLLFGYGLSLPSLIGLLMLMGIVTKNSILLVEYVVMARNEHGMSRTDALIDACAKRARPIIMTTIAMIAGMLPVAAGFSADPSFRAPMGISVIGGLITSTALSLFVVPTI